MASFYDNWLSYWDDEQEERAKDRKCIHEEELEWVRTKQDYKAALVCGRENGFITAGAIMLGLIPQKWNTGKHSHGEEAMFILEGEGFSVVDGERYDWGPWSCLFMPYGAVHQHFNTGETEVRYISAMSIYLERFASLAKVVQYEEACETPLDEPKEVEKAKSDIHPEYGRIVMKIEDALVLVGKEQSAKFAERKDEYTQTLAKEMRIAGGKAHHARNIQLMANPEKDFRMREVEFTGIPCEAAGAYSGKHAHMEALLYVLQGEGYSIVDGEKIPWKKGTLLHIPGPNTVHQHFNTGNVESQMLRCHYGLRSHFYQRIARRVFPYMYYEHSSY